MTGRRWIVDFWLDPACPLTRNTARWITSISEEIPLDVRWRVMSLSVQRACFGPVLTTLSAPADAIRL